MPSGRLHMSSNSPQVVLRNGSSFNSLVPLITEDCDTPTQRDDFVGLLSSPGVFNLLSSRANFHLSYNPAGRSHCRLQNHIGYIKHQHRGMGGSPGDEGEVTLT